MGPLFPCFYLFVHNLAHHVVVTENRTRYPIRSLDGHRQEPASRSDILDHAEIFILHHRRMDVRRWATRIFEKTRLVVFWRVLPVPVSANDDHILFARELADDVAFVSKVHVRVIVELIRVVRSDDRGRADQNPERRV